MRVAVYVRVSTSEQSVNSQLELIKRYCEFNGFEFDIFEDVESGACRERVELDRMLGLIDKGIYKRLVVYKIDRLARSIVHFSEIVSRVRGIGCEFVSVTEGLDFGTSTGRLMANILATFAEFERERIRERVVSGLEAARGRGVILGVRAREFDYDYYLSLRAEGFSSAEIALRMGFSRSQLYRRLGSRRKLVG